MMTQEVWEAWNLKYKPTWFMHQQTLVIDLIVSGKTVAKNIKDAFKTVEFLISNGFPK